MFQMALLIVGLLLFMFFLNTAPRIFVVTICVTKQGVVRRERILSEKKHNAASMRGVSVPVGVGVMVF